MEPQTQGPRYKPFFSRQYPSLPFSHSHEITIKPSALWPSAMETYVLFFQNGDPTFSEMGTKWGPSPAEWGPKKRMFSKLAETSQFVEIKGKKWPTLE